MVRFIIAFVAIFTLLLASPGRSQTEALDSVLQQWAEMRQRVKSLRLVAEGERMIAKGAYTGLLEPDDTAIIPADDEVFEESLTLTLDFEKNWARMDSVRPIGAEGHDGLVITKYSLAFDGERFYNFTPRDANPFKQNINLPNYTCDLRILKLDFAKMFFEPLQYPAFFLTGDIVRPDTGVTPDRLRIPDSAANYKVKGTGVFDGRDHLILVSPREAGQPPRYYEYWVDLTRGAVISKWFRISSGNVRYQYEVNGWQQIDGGWYPSAWRFDFVNADGTVSQSSLMEVKSLRFNEPFDQDFYSVKEQPGMYVINDVTGQNYEVQANGDEVPMQEVIDANESGSMYKTYSAVALAVVITGCFIAYRRVTRQH